MACVWRPVRRVFRSWIWLVFSSPCARAIDHCAPSRPVREADAAALAGDEPRSLGIGLSASVESATYATERYAGNYSGLEVALGYATKGLRGPAWELGASLPVYQLVRNGSDESGVGDAFFHGRMRLWRVQQVALGVGLGVSVPSGDAAADLGMGHFMLHPGVWFRAGLDEVRLAWALGYGGALGAEEHAHGPSPIVQPMNARELSAAGEIGWLILPTIELEASLLGAVPVAVQDGEARASARLGVRLLLGASGVGATLALPLLGDAFEQKLVVTADYSF